MDGNSRLIFSAQTSIHPDLERQLRRHCAQPYRKPILDYNRAAHAQALAAWAAACDRHGKSLPLILDAGCGVGWSSLEIARQYPGSFVIGVDQSEARLGRVPAGAPDSLVLVRADLVDFWRLLAEAGQRLQRHYVLYPNPWPKIGHLGRRWHGHAVFPVWRSLGGVLECRSNWSIYIEEMAWALGVLSGQPVSAEVHEPARFLTPFERKYAVSGHRLWRCQVVFD